jgi:hypothetical protein
LQQISQVKAEGIIRAYHHRTIEVYNQRLHRWEREDLLDFAACVPLSFDLLWTLPTPGICASGQAPTRLVSLPLAGVLTATVGGSGPSSCRRT